MTTAQRPTIEHPKMPYRLRWTRNIHHHTSAPVGNGCDSHAPEGTLVFVRGSTHLEDAGQKLPIASDHSSYSLSRFKDLVYRKGVCDIDLITQLLHLGSVVLLGLVPKQTLDRHVQTLNHHNLLVVVERLAQLVVLLKRSDLFWGVLGAVQELRVGFLWSLPQTEPTSQ